MDGKPKRRWLSYSVRTLLVVVTIFCVWLGRQVNWIRQREMERERITAADQWRMRNGTAFRDGRPYPGISYNVGPRRDAPWSLRIFGEAGETSWYLDMANEGPEIERIRELFPEASIEGRPRSEPWPKRTQPYRSIVPPKGWLHVG